MQQGTGTTFKAISGSFIRDIDVPIAPLNEQKRIADKLDTLLARVDASRAHLERVQAILKDFRQSVLAAAVSGRLTEEWREKNNSECVFLQSPQMTEYNDSLLPDLPNSWEWQRFGNVATIESNLVDPQKYQNYPHIAPNYIESQTGRLLAYGTVASDNIISANHLFRPGQIIYSKIRPYLCKAVIVNFSGLCSADMYPISGKLVSSEYLHKWLISQQFTLFASSKQGRTVLPKINQKALNEIPVPIPPAKEQQEIVRRVEVLFDYADRLETQTQAALDRVDNLTPSLLAKAFRGELVEQDPNDEPASVLLARIRAERAQQPKLDVKKRVTKKVKMTENSVKEMIQKLPQDTFSFDELREMLPGNYDELKNILFKLLAEPNPSIMQVFDTNLQAIRFVRSAK
jgi:type I restriction enzyme S subunit